MRNDRCIFLLSLPQGRLRCSSSCCLLKRAKLCLMQSVRSWQSASMFLLSPASFFPHCDFLGGALPNIGILQYQYYSISIGILIPNIVLAHKFLCVYALRAKRITYYKKILIQTLQIMDPFYLSTQGFVKPMTNTLQNYLY